MTTETSNAREPDVAMALHWIDRYAAGIDDECQIDLVADALGVTLPDGYAAAPPPAAAEPKTLPVPTRVYLTDKAAVIVGDPQRGWDEEVPEAHNCDAMGCATIGPHVLARVPFTDERAISQPDPKAEARGVVDEGSRIVTSQLLHWGGIPVRVTGTVTTSPGNWPLIDAALTESGNEQG